MQVRWKIINNVTNKMFIYAYFCNTTCQKLGWKRHKQECKKLREKREKQLHDDINVGAFFNAMNKGGGVGGVLGIIFDFLFHK